MRPIRDLRWASVFTSLAARALESRVTFVGAAVALTVFTSGVPLLRRRKTWTQREPAS